MTQKVVDTTLEEYLNNAAPTVTDFKLGLKTNIKGKTEFYIHPFNKNGKTLDFKVSGNSVKCTSVKSL